MIQRNLTFLSQQPTYILFELHIISIFQLFITFIFDYIPSNLQYAIGSQYHILLFVLVCNSLLYPFSTHLLYLSSKNWWSCNLYSTPLLLLEHVINLLLQGGNHREELLLSCQWWLLVENRCCCCYYCYCYCCCCCWWCYTRQPFRRNNYFYLNNENNQLERLVQLPRDVSQILSHGLECTT